MKTPHEFKTKEKSDSKPRKEVKDSASQTAKEIGVKSHSKEVTDDKKPIDKAPESHAKKLATQKELKLNKADETLTEEQLIKNALKFDKLQPSTQEPPAPKILSVNAIDKTASNQTQQEDDGTNVNTTLVFAEIVLRHGDRYKGYDDDETYPYDPYSQEDPFWLPYGCDQLRNKGKMRSYWLGLFMRKRYNGFLKDEYYHNDVRLTSADLDRCIDSAHVMTAGLYPPKGINIWNDNVGRYYQPIPVRTLDAENDIYLNEDVHCVPYEMELAKVLLQGMKNFNLKYKYVYEYLEMYTGMSVSNLMDVARIYTTLRIEVSFLSPS
ncbi:venom acid phosphatase Acph-1-like [Diaphorina citri]|uniref:acid phosphatase n=1 Tax=Diaphorina citri TaxID=121845 RepID=A0A3Q0JLG0_DIACI|nr:venom acid phosphatase Acph-1-like [Diaphorina citri]